MIHRKNEFFAEKGIPDEEVRKSIVKLFEHRDAHQVIRWHYLIYKISEAAGLDRDEFRERFDALMSKPNYDGIERDLYDSLKPLINFHRANPKISEQIERDFLLSDEGNRKLSELLFYNLDESETVAEIHVAPGKTLANREVIKAFLEGLKALAKDFERNKNLKMVTAQSWIVAAHPRILTSAGFTFDGIVSKEELGEHWQDETRPVGRAHMDRKPFLERYGSK